VSYFKTGREKVILTGRRRNFTKVVLILRMFEKIINLRHLETVQGFLIRYDMI